LEILKDTKIFSIPANEEWMICREIVEILR